MEDFVQKSGLMVVELRFDILMFFLLRQNPSYQYDEEYDEEESEEDDEEVEEEEDEEDEGIESEAEEEPIVQDIIR